MPAWIASSLKILVKVLIDKFSVPVTTWIKSYLELLKIKKANTKVSDEFKNSPNPNIDNLP
jgi:hypothetical protein